MAARAALASSYVFAIDASAAVARSSTSTAPPTVPGVSMESFSAPDQAAVTTVLCFSAPRPTGAPAAPGNTGDPHLHDLAARRGHARGRARSLPCPVRPRRGRGDAALGPGARRGRAGRLGRGGGRLRDAARPRPAEDDDLAHVGASH